MIPNMNMQKRLNVFWLLSFLFIGFIFFNSLLPGKESGSLSLKVTVWLLRYVQQAGFTIELERFHHYVRKLAHFSEYACLGILVTAAIHRTILFSPKWLNFSAFWLLTPFLDETIQSFVDGRVMAFTDMCIDAMGFITGSFLCWVLILIIKDLDKKGASK